MSYLLSSAHAVLPAEPDEKEYAGEGVVEWSMTGIDQRLWCAGPEAGRTPAQPPHTALDRTEPGRRQHYNSIHELDWDGEDYIYILRWRDGEMLLFFVPAPRVPATLCPRTDCCLSSLYSHTFTASIKAHHGTNKILFTYNSITKAIFSLIN